MVKLLYGATTSMSTNRGATHEIKQGAVAVFRAYSRVGRLLQPGNPDPDRQAFREALFHFRIICEREGEATTVQTYG
jgi:hypothetical protein